MTRAGGLSAHAFAHTLALAVALAPGPPARAQDFDLPAPAWPPGPAGAWLERALPPAAPSPAVESGLVRWHGLASLTTRALAAGAGVGPARVALGLSQTGEPDLGWTALAAAVGAAGGRGGASLRALARRDRTSRFGFDARGAEVGVELGGGAWLAAREGLHVWAVAPQVWTRGAPPPLARPLEIGAAADLGAVTLWLARAGVGGATPGGRAAGLATGAGPLAVWLSARDRPLRGGLGVAARARGVRVAAELVSHPVLGETARLSLGAGGAP
jgi:hypothetical protein